MRIKTLRGSSLVELAVVVPLVVLLIATFGADIGPFTTAVAVFGAGAVTPNGALAVALAVLVMLPASTSAWVTV